MNLQKHQFEELEMNMTPMIDVVFLLIIFFMLITDMTQQDLEVLTLPKATTAVPDEPDPDDFRPVINITQTGSMIVRRDEVFTSSEDGGDEDETGLKKQMLEYADLMEKEPFNLETGSGPMIPGDFLLIRADQYTLFHYVQRVMTIAGDKDIQIWKVQLAAATDEETQE